MSKKARNLIILTICIGMVIFIIIGYSHKSDSNETTEVVQTPNSLEHINYDTTPSLFDSHNSITIEPTDDVSVSTEEIQSSSDFEAADESNESSEIESTYDVSASTEEDIQSSSDFESVDGSNDSSEQDQSSGQIPNSPLPDVIQDMIYSKQDTYPGMLVSVGIYSLDGTESYELNPYTCISSGCTVKAPYAMYVLQTCELQGIDIYNHTIEYQYGMQNGGSGTIQYSDYGTEYTISELLTLLLGISDNTAYNILLSEFPLTDFQVFLDNVGGQQLDGARFGATNVIARKNEWFAIWDYINSDSEYSYVLRDYLTGTNYCYLAQGMDYEHNFLHKSGWSDGSSYTCACDCAIIDDKYLIIVMTEDYTTGEGHVDALCSIGWAIEQALLI